MPLNENFVVAQASTIGRFPQLILIRRNRSLGIQEVFDELRDPRVAPPTILRRLVSAGRLGRKTGRGVFDYGER